MRGAFIPGALTDGGLSERASAVLRGAKGSPKSLARFYASFAVLRRGRVDSVQSEPETRGEDDRTVIQSAIGNAVNNQGLDRDRLVVAEATCGKDSISEGFPFTEEDARGDASTGEVTCRVTLEETDEEPRRRVRVHDDEMPWERRRRLGRAKQAIAEAAGIA